MAKGQIRTKRFLMAGVAMAALAACEGFDPDFRDIGNGFDTSQSVANMPGRPRPDDRGVISYPTYQVIVAKQDDTIRSISNRLGLDAENIAQYNGITPDQVLRRDEIIALPPGLRVPETGQGAAAGGTVDISAVATSALERAGNVTTTPLDTTTSAGSTPVAAQASAPIVQSPEPIRHQVQRGETVFAISRLYGVPVRAIADWNGLDSDFTVRTGQFLLIPQGNAPAPAATPTPVTAPGVGSPTPVPPSVASPLPTDAPVAAAAAPAAAAAAAATALPAAPDMGEASAAPDSRFVQPVQGSIFRAYAPGTNEGIDISAPAGTDVKAADSGTVAAVTADTNGVAILVIRHSDGLLTVYSGIDDLTVARNDTVTRGQTVGKIRAGDPPFLHFEVRRGLQSVDPTDFLP